MPFDGELLEDLDLEPIETHTQAERRSPWGIYAMIASAVLMTAGSYFAYRHWESKPTPQVTPKIGAISSNGDRYLGNGQWERAPGPAEAFRVDEDTYYDAAGGVVGSDVSHVTLRDDVGKDEQAPPPIIDCNGVRCTGSLPIGPATTLTMGSAMTTGTWLVSSTVVPQSVAIPIRDIDLGDAAHHHVNFPEGAALQVDGNGHAAVVIPRYDPQPHVTLHGVRSTYYDAAGFPLRSTTAIHFYAAEYCHGGLQSVANAPNTGRTPST